MYNFSFMLKTYSKDLEYTKRLIKSYEKFNVDGIPLFMVVDGEEKKLFESEFGKKKRIFVISKEDIDVVYATEAINGISSGYINQEIVKLSFWKLGLTKNYLCIDSELEFIREFHEDEFMYDKDIPYTVLIEDNELQVNPHYYDAYWVNRQKCLNIIKEELEIKDKHIMTCHGMQTFNMLVLQDMEEKFMNLKGYSYLDLLRISPYEFSWYNYYLQKERTIPIQPCEPHFKTYHMAYQQVVDVIQGISLETLKRGYSGIILNSNYSRERTNDFRNVENLDFFVKDKDTINLLKKIVRRSQKNFLNIKLGECATRLKKVLLNK